MSHSDTGAGDAATSCPGTQEQDCCANGSRSSPQFLGAEASRLHLAKHSSPEQGTRLLSVPWLGGLIIVLLGLEVVSGSLLLVHYRAARAEASVSSICDSTPYGWLVHNLHVLTANVLVGSVLLHALASIHRASPNGTRETARTARPRSLAGTTTWLLITGLVAGACVVAIAFSGTFLRWDSGAIGAATAMASLFQPLLGELLHPSSGSPHLFLAAHAVWLPYLAAALVPAHLALIRAHDLRSPGSSPITRRRLGLRRHVPVWMLAVCLLFLVASFMQPASARSLPGLRFLPPWYLMAPYEVLRRMPPQVAGLSGAHVGIFLLAALLMVFVLGLVLRPRLFLRKAWLALTLVLVVSWTGLTVAGYLAG